MNYKTLVAPLLGQIKLFGAMTDALRFVKEDTLARIAERRMNPANSSLLVNGMFVPLIRADSGKAQLIFGTFFHFINKAFFDAAVPRIPIEWNGRLRSCAGRFIPSREKIELSSRYFSSSGIIAMGVVLAHEMIHAWLYFGKKPHGHTGEFKKKSRSMGMPEIRHALPLVPKGEKYKILIHEYQCPVCNKVVEYRRRTSRKTACRDCCVKMAGGRFDPRFVLRLKKSRYREETG